MSEQRLKGWKKQETAFNYAEGREFGPGLRAERIIVTIRGRVRVFPRTIIDLRIGSYPLSLSTKNILAPGKKLS